MSGSSIEIWKDVPGYNGSYSVSSKGNVKSLPRVIIQKNGIKRFVKGGYLSFTDDSYGYLQTVLSLNGKRTTIKIHKLVAMAFLDHKRCGMKIVVDHIDNNQLNNNIDNLQLISTRENTSKDKKKNSSKYIGVSWYKPSKKWVSRININGKKKYLGYFNNELDAAKAYKNELKKL